MKKLALLTTALCACTLTAETAPGESGSAPRSLPAPVARVVLVGVDGLGARNIPWDDMPNLRALRDAGLYTVGRCGFPTLSAPNWMSILTGMPIELHGMRDNSGKPKAEPWDPNAPCVFSEVRRQEPDAFTVSAFTWDAFGWMHSTNAVSEVRHFDGPLAKYDAYAARAAATVDWVLSFLPRNPRLAFCYQGQADLTGHRGGWGSPAYTNACRDVDANIGRIVEAYKTAGLWEDTALILVADHGGHGHNHGDATMECFEVPFLVAGPAVTGLRLREPVLLIDTAPTILALLGLDIPDTMRGRPALR